MLQRYYTKITMFVYGNGQRTKTNVTNTTHGHLILCDLSLGQKDLVKLKQVVISVNMLDHFTKQVGPTLFH